MKTILHHNWAVTPKEARNIQADLATRVIVENKIDNINLIAGVDAGFEESGTVTRAAVVVLTFPDLILVEEKLLRQKTSFPYIPGLLSFRELPAITEALATLKHSPDIIMCDGHGISHPRHLGVASHLGVLLDIPTIGAAKKPLVGIYEMPELTKNSLSLLIYKNKRIGTVLRTRDNVKPMFISPGHKIDFDMANKIVMHCARGFRLPEPTRLADKLASHRKHIQYL